MSTRDDIRAALKKHGPLSLTELAQHCPSCENDRQIVASAIAQLRAEGKVKGFGYDAASKPVYNIDHWPERPNESAAEAEQVPARALQLLADTPPPSVIQTESATEAGVLKAILAAGPEGLRRPEVDKLAGAKADEILAALIEAKSIKRTGRARGTRYVAGSQQPEARRKGVERKRRDRPAPSDTPRPAADTRPPNGVHAAFAINEVGELGIEKAGTKVSLDKEEFYRLREFIQRAQPIWEQPAA